MLWKTTPHWTQPEQKALKACAVPQVGMVSKPHVPDAGICLDQPPPTSMAEWEELAQVLETAE